MCNELAVRPMVAVAGMLGLLWYSVVGRFFRSLGSPRLREVKVVVLVSLRRSITFLPK